MFKEELDMALQDTKERKKAGQICNVFTVCGLSGSGKTSTIQDWIKENNLKSLWIDRTFTEQNIDGVSLVFDSKTIDNINDGETVVVFDDYDWVPLSTRKHFFNLIKNSKVIDYREKAFYNCFNTVVNLGAEEDMQKMYEKKLDNIFMIIVVTHPTLSSFAEDYTEEEKTIFGEHQLLC